MSASTTPIKRVLVAAAAVLQVAMPWCPQVPMNMPALPSHIVAWAEEATNTQSSTSVLEEAWDFTNRFSLDRSHNGKDWQAVKQKFLADIKAGRTDQYQATKDMLRMLGDKYTRLVDPETYLALSKFDLVGAGVMLSPNAQGKLAVAAPPAPGSAASRQGLQKGELVTAINGAPTDKMNSFDVIELLSKYQGKTITFTMKRLSPGGDYERDVVLERTFQKVKNPIKYSMTKAGDHKVGYIKVKEFNAVVTDKLREAVNQLTADGAEEFILDLRGNGGGAFQTALGIAGLFMDNQPITYVVDGEGKALGFSTKSDAITSAPLVVWVDGGSASASEVLIAALKDDCRALVVGDRSFGKGIIQAVYGLSDGSGLIVTVAKYKSPRGDEIQGKGIQPDRPLPLSVKLLGITPGVPQDAFDEASKRRQSCPPIDSSPV